ncbi:pentraxin-4 [Osmerus eperlanus]|uniref:pentraxin-4 n=1 Tax=Osmerus eperlanus TaxID=29151 RepID=UPI002E0FF754
MSSFRPSCGCQLLVLLLVQLQLNPGAAQPEHRTPVYQRLQRIDEQFQRFQEKTLTHLETLNRRHNVSSSLEARLQTLTDQYHGLSQDLNHLRETTSQEMDSLRESCRKIQKKSRRMEGWLASLERSLRDSSRQAQRQKQGQGDTASNFTMELQNQEGRLSSIEAQQEQLMVGLRDLQLSLGEKDVQMRQLERRVGEIVQGNGVSVRVSGRTGDPINPQDPAPPRAQTSRRDRVRTSPHLKPKHTPPHSNPQYNLHTHSQTQPQSSLKPHLHSNLHPQAYSTTEHPQPINTQERRMRTRIPLPPPQPSQRPSHREGRGRHETGRQSPEHGLIKEGAVSQFGSEWRKGKEMERRTGNEQRKISADAYREGKGGGEEERREDPAIQNLLQLPLRHKIPQLQGPRKEGNICNVDSMLLFPSASSDNYVTFARSFPNLPELSVCLWLRVDVGYIGTLLSYATEDNDNSLVLYGHRATVPRDTLDFVLGDPVYRQLHVDAVLDGRWHHLCFLWSSIEGRFWHYTDRRLTSTGSKFRKGYEVPGGGSVVLGQEQDTVGGGFDPEEGFAGRIAGFVVWNRVLSPGEVAGVATGKGVPRGVVLTLEDVAGVHGEVQKVACECLEHCV